MPGPNALRPLHPRTAMVLQHVQEAMQQESTLESVLDNPVVTGFATGDELSRPQRGLVAATVSLMQDKLIEQLRFQADDLRRSLESERFMLAALANNFAASVKAMYTIPFLSFVRPAGNVDLQSEPPKKKSKWAWLLTWGNISAAMAIIAFAVALFYTKAYASYKDRAESQAETITDINDQLSSVNAEKGTIVSQLEALQKANKEANMGLEFNSSFIRLNRENNQLKSQLQRYGGRRNSP